MKHGILPGGDKGARGSSFFNHYAPWDKRATTVLRSKVPTEDVPIVLYVPIARLQRLGARLAEISYVVVWDPNIRTSRRSWREWDQDREEEEHSEQDHEN